MQLRLFTYEEGDLGLTYTDVEIILIALSDWAYAGRESWVPTAEIKLQHLEASLVNVGFGYLSRVTPGPPGIAEGVRKNGTVAATVAAATGEVASA